jgi:dTDP-4-dehydrorhamnose 3,5-epimerase
MQVIPDRILPDVLHMIPELFGDPRGYLYEVYNQSKLEIAGINLRFNQANIVKTEPLGLRGMHYQESYPQGKLITVLSGDIFDVVMDIRPKSKYFGVAASFRLFENEQVYIPPGFAHGFLSDDNSKIIYQMTNVYYEKLQRSIRWDTIPGIVWPTSYPILSTKDAEAPTWTEISKQLTK